MDPKHIYILRNPMTSETKIVYCESCLSKEEQEARKQDWIEQGFLEHLSNSTFENLTEDRSEELAKALSLAYYAHLGQVDKSNVDYILHPLRVSFGMSTQVGKIAALLHDVVEDTDITLSDLRLKGFGEDVVEIVDLVTRREDESYDEFICRCRDSKNRTAIDLKVVDIKDNLGRINDLEPDVARFLKKKYRRSLKILDGGD